MDNFIVFAFLVGLVLGGWIASIITRDKWMDNASAPYRLLEKGKFFKVIEIEFPESWLLADIHRPSEETFEEHRKKNGWCDI